MSKRTGSADLPLHGGRVPAWLYERMMKLGAVISPGDRPGVWARRAAAAAGASVLVPVVRRRDGDGLAFVRHHDERHRRAEARARAAERRARAPCLRRARKAFAEDAGRAGGDRQSRRVRRRGAGEGEQACREGRQRGGAGRVRALSPRLHRRRRRQVGRGAAGDARRGGTRAALSLAERGAHEFRRGAARGDRRARSRARSST